MSAEPIEKTDLEILEEKLNRLETLSVRGQSEAARSCQHLITVVMCTFAPPKLAVVMNALLTFPEKQKVTSKDLSEAMKLDKKQMREYLSNLKSMGYILETTGITEWAHKGRNRGRGGYGGYGGFGRTAQYHVDYQYFIMMTKFRLHSILKRLNAQQKKEDDMGDGYVCCNTDCYSCYKVKKVMDLIYEQQNSLRGRIEKESHFVCPECGEPLTDAQKYYDNQNATLTKTMRFNLQMKSLRLLLTTTEQKVIRERQQMSMEISRIEDAMDRIKNGSSHSAYKAATLSFDINGMRIKNGATRNGGGTGLAHLDRIGRRKNYVNTKEKFLCNIDDEEMMGNNIDGNDMNNNENGENMKELTEEEKKKRIETEKNYQSDLKKQMLLIKDYEISRQIKGDKQKKRNNGNGNNKNNNNNDDNDGDEDIDLYPFMKVKVNGIDVTLKDILKAPEKYESKMSCSEWNEYQEMMDDFGLLEVD